MRRLLVRQTIPNNDVKYNKTAEVELYLPVEASWRLIVASWCPLRSWSGAGVGVGMLRGVGIPRY